MEKDWVKVFTTEKTFEAEFLKGILAENGIRGIILNKKDSSYMTFGDVELYVHNSNVLEAINIINKRSNE